MDESGACRGVMALNMEDGTLVRAKVLLASVGFERMRREILIKLLSLTNLSS